LELSYNLKNTDRTVGARNAGEIAYAHGDKGLPEGTLP
jgi:glutamate synthase domain-containing protein 3